jgi:hypothetical protein
MNELGLVHHLVQFHSRFPATGNIRPISLVSLVQLLERQLNDVNNESKHRITLMSDNLLLIDNKQLRVSIEANGDIDIAWTLNVCAKLYHAVEKGFSLCSWNVFDYF